MTKGRVLLIAAVAAVAAIIALVAVSAHRGGGAVLVDSRMEDLVKGVPKGLSVRVDEMEEGGRFKVEYTCDGADVAPEVRVSNVPSEAKALVLIMYDPDAPMGTFIHWLGVWKASPPEQVLSPSSALSQGRNDFRRTGYGGPCPPRGHGTHRYFFLVIAVDKEVNLRDGFSFKDLERAVKGHVISWGYFMGTYSR